MLLAKAIQLDGSPAGRLSNLLYSPAAGNSDDYLLWCESCAKLLQVVLLSHALPVGPNRHRETQQLCRFSLRRMTCCLRLARSILLVGSLANAALTC